MNLLFANDRRGAYPPSLYADQNAPLAPFPALKGETRADVAIVGAGYTGLSAALHLARAGLDVVVLDAQRVGFGASGRNGGQIGSGQRQEVDWLERHYGADTARALWNMAESAKALTRDLAAAAGVSVHDGVAHACRTPAELAHAHHLADRLAGDYGYDRVQKLDRDAFRAIVPSDAYIGGDLDHGAGHCDPLALAFGMARLAADAGARIHERTQVHHIEYARKRAEKTVLRTETGRVICDQVILAGNGYLGRLNRLVAARVMPINNYIVATAPLGARVAEVLRERIAVADTKFVVNYWRLSDDDRLIFGGGESVSYRFPRDIRAKVRPHLAAVYPGLADVELTHAWGGTLAITRNRMPCLVRPAPNCLSASGYSGHGVAMATLSGRLMADVITGAAAGFDLLAGLPASRFPGGDALRWPMLVAGMLWFSLRDKLGI